MNTNYTQLQTTADVLSASSSVRVKSVIIPVQLHWWMLYQRRIGYLPTGDRRLLVPRRPDRQGTRPCIPGRKSRKTTNKYDNRRYKCRNRIERMFGRIKDWIRVATRYDTSPTVPLSAIMLAATVIFWLWALNLAASRKMPYCSELGAFKRLARSVDDNAK